MREHSYTVKEDMLEDFSEQDLEIFWSEMMEENESWKSSRGYRSWQRSQAVYNGTDR